MIATPFVITATDLDDAWRQAATLLLSDTGGRRMGLMIHIEEPSMPSPSSLNAYDSSNIDPSIKSIADVANTIFPKKGRMWDKNFTVFSDWYGQAYNKRNTGAWGTYFQRMIEFGPNRINQLERVLNGLTGWGANHAAAFVIHVSSSDLDRPRKLGGPCMQYIQIGVVEAGKLGLTVVYRSHDYYQKTLGNFLGLSRLLHYLCAKSRKEVGPITCMSSYAFLSGTKTNTRTLLGL